MVLAVYVWGWGGRGGPLFSNQPATEIKGREEDGRPRFLMERGKRPTEGAQCWRLCWAFSIKNKNKGEKNYFGKKKVQTMPQTISGSLTRFRGIGDGREPR